MLHLQKAPTKAWPGEKQNNAFLRTGFRNWKKALTSFRAHQQSKCHFAALTSELTAPQCLDVIAIANLLVESKGNRNCMFGNFTEKDLYNNNNKLFA